MQITLLQTAPILATPTQLHDFQQWCPQMSQHTDIRKLLYSPSLPFMLSTIMCLGPPFSHLQFLNLIFLRDLKDTLGGERFRGRRLSSFALTDQHVQFFCQMFKDSLRNLDLLIALLKHTFAYGEIGDLMEKHMKVKEFLHLSNVKGARRYCLRGRESPGMRSTS